MKSISNGRSIMIGPWIAGRTSKEVDVVADASQNLPEEIEKALNELGAKWYFGKWDIPGSPEVLLLDHTSLCESLEHLKKLLFEKTGVQIPPFHDELESYLRFGWLVYKLCTKISFWVKHPLVCIFHEWMSSIGIIFLEAYKNIGTVFITHATILGRYLCSGNVDLYREISQIDPFSEARIRGIYCHYLLERACAHKASVFTTVSNITAFEAEILLNRKPDGVLPNGISIRALPAIHDVLLNHMHNRKAIDKFIEGHFLGTIIPSNSVYFFIAGRSEFRNKGFDMFLDSINGRTSKLNIVELNRSLCSYNSQTTAVVFIISNGRTNGFNTESLWRQLVYERFRNDKSASSPIKWKYTENTGPAPIVTHNMQDDNDMILNRIRDLGLVNKYNDKVKIVYIPEFLDSNSPLFPISYEEFISGCHVGIFPSYYEPWGYTPAECILKGVCAVTSNLSGFGCFMEECLENPGANGLLILDRRNQNYHASVSALSDYLFAYCSKTDKKRLMEKHRVAKLSCLIGWDNLIGEYNKAINLANLRCTKQVNEEQSEYKENIIPVKVEKDKDQLISLSQTNN